MRETLAQANLGRRSRVGESKEKVAYSSTPPGANERICRYANFLASVQTRCTTHAAALLAFVMREALGSRPAPGRSSDCAGGRPLKVPAALRVRFLRTACPACWLLDVSRLIASRMVFRAQPQGERPASCLTKRILVITEAGPGFRAEAGIGFRIPLTGGLQIRADASYSVCLSALLRHRAPPLHPRLQVAVRA